MPVMIQYEDPAAVAEMGSNVYGGQQFRDQQALGLRQQEMQDRQSNELADRNLRYAEVRQRGNQAAAELFQRGQIAATEADQRQQVIDKKDSDSELIDYTLPGDAPETPAHVEAMHANIDADPSLSDEDKQAAHALADRYAANSGGDSAAGQTIQLTRAQAAQLDAIHAMNPDDPSVVEDAYRKMMKLPERMVQVADAEGNPQDVPASQAAKFAETVASQKQKNKAEDARQAALDVHRKRLEDLRAQSLDLARQKLRAPDAKAAAAIDKQVDELAEKADDAAVTLAAADADAAYKAYEMFRNNPAHARDQAGMAAQERNVWEKYDVEDKARQAKATNAAARAARKQAGAAPAGQATAPGGNQSMKTDADGKPIALGPDGKWHYVK